MENKVIFWDFDGTLVYCHHLWSSSMWRALTDEPSGENITLEEVRPHMQKGYPWDLPNLDSSALSTPEIWWGLWKSIFTVLPVLSVCRKKLLSGFPARFESTF